MKYLRVIKTCDYHGMRMPCKLLYAQYCVREWLKIFITTTTVLTMASFFLMAFHSCTFTHIQFQFESKVHCKSTLNYHQTVTP